MLCPVCNEFLPYNYAGKGMHPRCKPAYEVAQRILKANGQIKGVGLFAEVDKEDVWISRSYRDTDFSQKSWSTKPYKNKRRGLI